MTDSKDFKFLLPWGGAIASGILMFVGYAGFDQFYLEWFFLLPLLWALRGQRPKRAFILGWLAGIVGHGGGFYWIIQMFQQFAGAPWIAGVFGLLLLAAANGIVLAVWAWGTTLVTRDRQWQVLWAAPVIWTAMEKLWPEVFPNYLGASQYRISHLTQIADFAGILGVSFLVIYINATLYWATVCWREQRTMAWRAIAALAVTLLLVTGYGELRIREVERKVASAQRLTVGLVQTNRGAADNHLAVDLMQKEHRDLSRELVAVQKPDLVVWPEGVLSVSLASREGSLPTWALGDLQTPLLFGACLQIKEEGETRFCNSALLADGSGRILGNYDKTVLVPFGEYIPFGDIFPQLYAWSPYSAKFFSGRSTQPLKLGSHLLSVSICYEDIFPTHIRKLMRGGGEGRKADVMFNLTNDSWYGNSVEPVEHLALASFRSIENRRSLVRVTNTGISAFVDPVGRIVSRTGVWTREVLVDRVPLLDGGTLYGAAGDWIGWLCAAISLFVIARSTLSKKARASV
ncbi:apolipoprotein N-acyltransferase [Geomonas subterranea]|uniref:Apolipoprotein N-acyltransferase n=1 Tax=Geomonas subterranea TaxID=2847989 RepID=A0ABX8LF31_9BACT|nr:apolipoprotein N-acyltransferase [Geomonas subterranea]QXE90663.1 apolipoprotein N-acyltransferase [Geomonas subterranea]QXM11256.1 apolipoprotein N-acyltransferase [Geomonas subterranea]